MSDGYNGECQGCGADGLWEEIPMDNHDFILIRCECGHEEVIEK